MIDVRILAKVSSQTNHRIETYGSYIFFVLFKCADVSYRQRICRHPRGIVCSTSLYNVYVAYKTNPSSVDGYATFMHYVELNVDRSTFGIVNQLNHVVL